MKKLTLTVFAVICAFCFVLGAGLLMNVNTVKAETAGTTPTLSETKVKISNDNDKMLLVTAIKDYADVYEVGYTFNADVNPVQSQSKKYYTAISDGVNTLTPADIFDGVAWAGDEGVGMIIWEIPFVAGTEYGYKAYALVGERDGESQLVLPSEEVRVTPNDYTVKKLNKVTIVANNDDYGTVSKSELLVLNGTSISVEGNVLTIGQTTITATQNANDANYNYGFTGFDYTGETVTSNMTITANFSREEIQYAYSVTYMVGEDVIKQVEDIPTNYGASVSNDQVVTEGANVYVFPKTTEVIDSVEENITVIGSPISSVDFAEKESDFDFITNTETTFFDSKECISLQGMARWNKEVINAARAAGYWTMTMSIYVSTDVAENAIFGVHGYMEGGNTHNMLSNTAYHLPTAGASTVTYADEYKGVWHTVYLDLTRFYDDEELFFYYGGANSEIYVSEIKLHWVQQDLSSGSIDILNPTIEYELIPTFTASVRSSLFNDGEHGCITMTASNVYFWGVYSGTTPHNDVSLLRGYLVKAKEAGYANISLDLWGCNLGTTYVGQFYCGHTDACLATAWDRTTHTFSLDKLLAGQKPDGTEIGAVDLQMLARADVRLSFQSTYTDGGATIVYSISFS